MTAIWLASGVRTPFARAGGALARRDALQLSVPVIQAMLERATPDLAVWGAVAPNLTWSNLAREAMLEAGGDPAIAAYSVVMACATSMTGAFAAAGMLDGRGRSLALVGGAESMSRIQIGLSPGFSDDLRAIVEARSMKARLAAIAAWKHFGLYIPQIKNRATGKSMGEHTEEMAKAWNVTREAQDRLAFASHRNAAAAWERGFFDDLVLELDGLARDGTVRADTTLERLAALEPSFDRTSGRGTLTAGNSSPLTDGAAALWVATTEGLERLPAGTPRARLIDWETNAIDLHAEHLLMAPAYAIPRILGRQGLSYEDVALWEIHEAFAAQVLAHVRALEDGGFVRGKAGVDKDFGRFPIDRVNPNGGSTALGHPFGATGARILGQAIKSLSVLSPGSFAIVSICADGGQGAVALLQAG